MLLTFAALITLGLMTLSGNLSIVPYKERFTDGAPGKERGLKKVHTECWNGFVFVCLADQPMPFKEFLGPLDDILSPYRFDKMTLVQDQTVNLDCNWKAVIDNFSELYHVDFLASTAQKHGRLLQRYRQIIRAWTYWRRSTWCNREP